MTLGVLAFVSVSKLVGLFFEQVDAILPHVKSSLRTIRSLRGTVKTLAFEALRWTVRSRDTNARITSWRD